MAVISQRNAHTRRIPRNQTHPAQTGAWISGLLREQLSGRSIIDISAKVFFSKEFLVISSKFLHMPKPPSPTTDTQKNGIEKRSVPVHRGALACSTVKLKPLFHRHNLKLHQRWPYRVEPWDCELLERNSVRSVSYCIFPRACHPS